MMITCGRYGLMLLLAGGLAACDAAKVTDDDIPLTPDAQMADAVRDPQTLVVDVRRPEDYAAGHIPGAMNIYLPDIRSHDPRLGQAKRIIVYGSRPDDPLGIAAAKRLVALGYTGVEEYKGGLERWRAEGRQIVTTLPPDQTRPDTQR